MKHIKDVTQELVNWAGDLLPALNGKYSFAPEYKDKGLPDVACEIVNVRKSVESPEQGWALEHIEQRSMRIYEAELLFMVPPEPPQDASNALADFIDTLTESLEAGALRDSFSSVSTEYNASFRPPFVEFDDGTRGRQVTLQITVGERI